MAMLRSTRKVKRHQELLHLLIMHPNEGREAAFEMGLSGHLPSELTVRQEKTLINQIKEKVNGSDH